MAYLALKNDTYLVEGAHRAALYDLDKEILYSVSPDITDFIKSLASRDIDPSQLSNKEKAFYQSLHEAGLIEKTKQPTPLKSILSLKKKYPIDFAWIEVTRRCNLACTFCYEGSNPYCTETMTYEEFKLVANNLHEIGVQKIQFIGGEPTVLKSELKKMIEYARPLFRFIEVYSNGVMIDETWCGFFKKHNIHLALSIHSYIPEEHDRITLVKGSHRKVLKALDLIKEYQISYRIGSVRSKACKVGKKPENSSYHLNPKLPKVTGRADLESFDLDMFKEKAITKASKRFPLSKPMVMKSVSGHQCFVKDLYISSLLDVFPCVMERRMSHGNIKNNKLKDIIDNNIRYLTKDNIDGCKDCEYRYACFDCRPDSNGKAFLSKPWHCSYDPTKGQWHDLNKMYQYLTGSQKLRAIPVVTS